MTRPVITNVDPRAAVEGGEVVITCADFEPRSWRGVQVSFADVATRPESVSGSRVIVPVPPGPHGEVSLRVAENGERSEGVTFHVADKLAENLHPVANPAYDRDNGTIFTTLSGSRGQEVPVSVYKISTRGESQPFLADITNPTGLAFDPDGQLFITSRYDGTVYRVSPFKEAEPFARNLGIATGIAFDSSGRMYVGDRTGTIYRVNEIGDPIPFATLEPSMAAYHLAFGPDRCLYVTGPTASSFDSIYRVDTNGEVSNYFTGLGRPQGLAFDVDGNVYVVASYQGRRGIFRITPGGDIEMSISGQSLVGLCFDDRGHAIVASTHELFRVWIGVRPFWAY
jgi:sugar lactone lactonase YvrE